MLYATSISRSHCNCLNLIVKFYLSVVELSNIPVFSVSVTTSTVTLVFFSLLLKLIVSYKGNATRIVTFTVAVSTSLMSCCVVVVYFCLLHWCY